VTKRMVVTDQAFGGTAIEEELARARGVEFFTHQVSSEADTIAVTAGADVVLVNFAPITEAVLAGLAPGATVIRYGIGYDNVDTAAARRHGVAVANVPQYGTETVADHAAACLLALLRKLPLYDRAIRAHGWCQPGALGSLPGFASTTIGLIGAGRIALSLARRLRPFGFRVVAYDPYADADLVHQAGVELLALEDVLAQTSAVSLHVPVTQETRHMVDRRFLDALRPGTVLVNTSRGGLVDEAALAEALSSGHLAAAALDVFDPEPLAPESPLRSLQNVLLTPHAAFFSDDSVVALQRLATEEAGRALAGDPLSSRVV
jgi:D-3-phosphoglycerate dehydrogenase / 2-oxoglutarate reductase